jgi:hypothetical protein
MKAKRLIYILSALTVVFLAGKNPVLAEEITIENNGAGASSEVSVQQATQTTVAQTNNSTVNNDVAVKTDTGSNQVSDNSGPATITTGEVKTETTLTNNVNQTKVDQPCCTAPADTKVVVSGNGEGSASTVNLEQTKTTDIQITQTATITNEIRGTAVTGQNTASDNGGPVSITTGDIKGKVTLVNSANNSDIKVGQTSDGDTTVKIIGNGTNSVNIVNLNDQNVTQVFKQDNAEILNRLNFILITGQNTANDNNGPVTITTGDVTFEAAVANDPVNQNIIDIGCCEEKPIPPVIPPVKPPEIKPPEQPQPPSNGGGGSGDGDGTSSSAGVGGVGSVLGEILPATGTLDMLLFFIGSVLFLLLGGYLRLISGRAPAKV